MHSDRARRKRGYQTSSPFLLEKQSCPVLRSLLQEQQEPEKSIYPHKSLKDLCIRQAAGAGRKKHCAERQLTLWGEPCLSLHRPASREFVVLDKQPFPLLPVTMGMGLPRVPCRKKAGGAARRCSGREQPVPRRTSGATGALPTRLQPCLQQQLYLRLF